MPRPPTRRQAILTALPAAAASSLSAAHAANVSSPDGKITITFQLAALDGKKAVPVWSVKYVGTPVLFDSRLGFLFTDKTAALDGFRITKTIRHSSNTEWTPLYGERSSIPDHYNELILMLDGPASFDIVLRAYNEGVAIRYRFAVAAKTIQAEVTEFRLPADAIAWEEHGTEGEYMTTPVHSIQPQCEWPLTVHVREDLYGSITEAALDRYPRMRLTPSPYSLGALITDLVGPAAVPTTLLTPWRAIILGRRPGDLLERNYLVSNLNLPADNAQFSWVKPGKAIREVTLSTPGGKACVDFAVRNNLQYVEYDAGWYGHEYDDAADARGVSLDPKRVGSIPTHPGLNLQEVIAYAKARGIGVILYVNRRALEKQLDELLPLYASWGVSGIKFGFVQVGPQQWTTWLMEAVRKAARHKMVIDIHDGYRPTGFSRTYPNLLTQEGIRGNEHMPTATHNATLPFTRCLAGASDYTICYYSARIKTTHAHQLAMAVIVYSPLLFLFWYDQPKDSEDEPELELFRRLPLTWDETCVLEAAIGEFATIARRKGSEWFIGAISADGKVLDLPLKFLSRSGVATIYADDPNRSTRTKVSVSTREVDPSQSFTAGIPAAGGVVIHIRMKS